MTLIDDIFEGMRLQSSVFCRMTLSGDVGFAKDAIDGAPFYLLLSGHAWLETSGNDALPLNTGDIVILSRGESHRLLARPDAELVPFRQVAESMGLPLWTPGIRFKTVDLHFGSGPPSVSLISGIFAFGDHRLNLLLGALPSVLLMRATTNSSAAGTVASISALLDAELMSGIAGAESICARLSDILFFQVVRHSLSSAESLPRGWLRGMTDAEVAPAIAIMHRAPDRPWSVASLAREVGISRSRFAARFQDVVGQAPIEYLTHWRMYQAAGRLAEGRIALPALALSVGYQSEVSFAAAFKRWSGRSPAEYRRRLLEPTRPVQEPDDQSVTQS